MTSRTLVPDIVALIASTSSSTPSPVLELTMKKSSPSSMAKRRAVASSTSMCDVSSHLLPTITSLADSGAVSKNPRFQVLSSSNVSLDVRSNSKIPRVAFL